MSWSDSRWIERNFGIIWCPAVFLFSCPTADTSTYLKDITTKIFSGGSVTTEGKISVIKYIKIERSYFTVLRNFELSCVDAALRMRYHRRLSAFYRYVLASQEKLCSIEALGCFGVWLVGLLVNLLFHWSVSCSVASFFASSVSQHFIQSSISFLGPNTSCFNYLII